MTHAFKYASILCATLVTLILGATDSAYAQIRRPHILPIEQERPPIETESPPEEIQYHVDWVQFDGPRLVSYTYDSASHVELGDQQLTLSELGRRATLSCHISGLVAIGYASSDGSASYNDRLAFERGSALLAQAQSWYERDCGQPLAGWRIIINRGEARSRRDEGAQRPVALLSLTARSSTQGLLTGGALESLISFQNNGSSQLFAALQGARGTAYAGSVTGYAQCQVIEDSPVLTGEGLCALLRAADQELGIF